MQTINNVTVAGSGVLGSQIAFQSAYEGYHVTLYDISDSILESAKEKFSLLKTSYMNDLGATKSNVEDAVGRIKMTSDLARSVADADLLIEAVPENVEIKKAFYQKLAACAPAKTIFASNSSTLLPSQFAEFSGRPAKFLNLHFANQIWIHNTAEIMGHAGTDPLVFASVVAFAKGMGMIALPLKKEQPGYILNTLLIPMLTAGLELLVNDVAAIETVDKTWMVATGTKMGPFAILDMVGITTAYNINKNMASVTKDPLQLKITAYLKTHFIDTGKLGAATGEGFYTYPDPAYAKADFLS